MSDALVSGALERQKREGKVPEGSGEFSLGSAWGEAKSFASGAWDATTGAIDSVEVGIQDGVNSIKASISGNRSKNLMPGAEPAKQTEKKVTFRGPLDWRVKLSIPDDWKTSTVLAPLLKTGGMCWPYTPSVFIGNSASYNSLKPIHSNYPFYGYQNSQPENITISGPFTVQNKVDGLYYLAVIHYLRSVTKMAYGQTSNQGAPPPVVKLSGYGDHIFGNVPVIVTNWTTDLSPDIDYILTETVTGKKGTYVPTNSNISVTLSPIYSRSSVEEFSLDEFVKGAYLGGKVGYL